MKREKKIDRRDVADILPLTPMQEGMLFHHMYNSEGEQYLEQISLNVIGMVNSEVIKKAWNHVAENNEALRAVFRWDKLDKPIQIILKNKEIPFRQHNLTQSSGEDQKKLLEEIRQNDKAEGINLEVEPFRVTLCKLGEDEYEMIISNHHILYDGWSNGIILKEFLEAYSDLMEGIKVKSKPKTNFKEFVNWVNSQDNKKQKEYWREYLRDFEQKIPLSNKIIKMDEAKESKKYLWNLSKETMGNIGGFTKEKNIRLAVLLYAAWGVLLQKYTDTEDVVFGTTVSGRNPKIQGIEDMVGLFINTLPLRIKQGGINENVETMITSIEKMLQQREEYEGTPLAEIQKVSPVGGKEGIFDSLVIIENYPLDSLLKENNGKIRIKSYLTQAATNYDLTVGIKVFDDIEIEFCYQDHKFEEKEIERLARCFENILNQIAIKENPCLKDIEILEMEEKQKLLYEFTKTDNNSGHGAKNRETANSIVELFQQQVNKTPEQMALKFGDQEITYRELNQQANQLARVIRKEVEMNSSKTNQQIIGIMLERSLEMCVAILGILKSGAAYLPIDPAYPRDRIQYMLEDGEIDVIITQQNLVEGLSFEGQVLDMEGNWVRKGHFDIDESYIDEINIETSNDLLTFENNINPQDLAYIIYTSGSTGKPKGVMVEQGNICNAIQWRKNEYNLTTKDRILQLFSFSFDGFLTSFFTPLVSGATVILLDEDQAKNPAKIKECIATEKITHFIAVPSLYSYILDEMTIEEAESLKIVTLAGEKITKEVIRKSQGINKALEIVNEYGPTENSVVSTVLRNVSLENLQSIGKPITNTSVYILGKSNQLRPIGLSGEICLAGRGLARGYLNRPEITDEKFISHPFVEGERLYKTGDLGRWMEDGTIEFLGRIDHQVKIRGFRIELGEIENRLKENQYIKEAVVVVRQQEETPSLLAYFTTEKEGALDQGELRIELAKSLPDYMIPSYFIPLETLPYTPNGKVDRNALPEMDGNIHVGTTYEAPANETEGKLVELWEKILGIKGIGRNDHFFNRGGHSLKAASLVSQIHKVFNVEIPLKIIFEIPTIKELAEYIERGSIEKGSIEENHRGNNCIKNSNQENAFKSLVPLEEKEFYPVAPPQKRLYMLQKYESQNIGYNISGALQIEGELDRDRFEGAFKQLIERHEAFRTSFEIQGEEVLQKIHKSVDFHLDYFEVNGEQEGEKEVEGLIKNFVAPFDLGKPPLLRAGLIRLEENKHILMLDMHHIIADGTSMGIIIKEFSQLYDGAALPKLKVQYKEYATWQMEHMTSKAMEDQKSYWVDRFKDEIPLLNIHSDHPRASVENFAGDTLRFSLGKEYTDKLKALAKDTGTTLYMILLSAYNVLLSKYSNQEDIVIGSPIAGRNHGDVKDVIGMFVNTLPMRNFLKKERTFKEFLQEVKVNALEAYQHQDYPFDDLVDQLKIQRDSNRNPLFDVLFAMQNMEMPEIRIEDLCFSSYPFHNKISKFDLSLFASEVGDKLEFEMEYSKIYNKETVEGLTNGFIRIIQQVLETPHVVLEDVEVLGEMEKNYLVWEIGRQEIGSQEINKTIHQRFEEQVERTPHNIALNFGNQTMTYLELNEKANQLARVLREKSIKAGSIVGLMMERSFEIIISILGIMKAGGAYLPIDTEYPQDRIAYMLQDSGVEILLTEDHLILNITEYFQGECIDVKDQSLYEGCGENLEPISTVEDIIYIVYTSGSTGNPKGIMMEHQNLINLMEHQLMKDGVDYSSRVLQFALISFDVSFQEIFLTFFSGGEVYLISREMRNDLDGLFELIKKNEIEVLFFPTAYLKFIMGEDEYIAKFPRNCKHIITAGEQLLISEGFKKYLRETKVRLHNHYGPSEAHVITTLTIDPNGDIPSVPSVGKPISNISIYIMDGRGRLQPRGVAGELYVSGDSVGRGYLNKPALTKEKFLEDPFKQGRRMYRTGDLARWRADGELEFLGRVDDQVKVRGHRIEISEIEIQLTKHDDIKEAVVVAKKDEKGSMELWGYVVTGEDLSATDIRNYLAQNLPEYMIPSYFMTLEKMPLTANGKIDRKALPEFEGIMETGKERVEASTELEKKLAQVWSEVLKLQDIGVTENFFDLGGHSLRATILLSKIQKELDVDIPLKEMFKTPTIRGLATYIQKLDKNQYFSIPVIEEKEYYPLSYAQKRMYTVHQFGEGGVSYNMPGAMKVIGDIEIPRVNTAFQKLIERHDALRTSFETIENETVQRIHRDVDFKVAIQAGKEEDTDVLIKEFIRPFDLNIAPLLRVEIVNFTEDSHLLLFDMHHIISDGGSMAILIQEFLELYQEKELPALRIQYKDYSAWQQNQNADGVIVQQEKYWLERFAEEVPLLNLPEDYVRPAVQSFEGDRVFFELDKGATQQLREFAKANGATEYMVLLATYTMLLGKYSGQEDIVVGGPIAGRRHADLENCMGMFVNTLAMRNYPVAHKTFKDFLQEVKENALRAYENQEYQFEELVDKLNIQRDLSRNPLFDVVFAMQNVDIPEIKIEGAQFIPYQFENKIAKFTMTLMAREVEDELSFDLEYCTKIFKKETMERFKEHFKKGLQFIIDNPDCKISEVEIITEEEKHQILNVFNDTKTEYPRDKTTIQLFEEQVEKTPDNIALIHEDQQLTYREINERANGLARTIQGKGIKQGDVVGLFASRSIEMVLGILGILKAGGAYLPIDTEYPKERIEYMLEDCNANILLMAQAFKEDVDFEGARIDLNDREVFNCSSDSVGNTCRTGKTGGTGNIDSTDNIDTSKNHDNPVNRGKATDLACIMYTSGSTGVPKGVMIEHRSIVRLVKNTNYISIGEGDGILQAAAVVFDVAIFEIWGSFLNGAALYLINKETLINAKKLRSYLEDRRPTIAFITTALFNQLAEEDPQMFHPLKYLIVGGDAVSPKHMLAVKKNCSNTALVDGYGPTENTTYSTCFTIPDGYEGAIPVGRPVSNSTVYILDKHNQLQPIGVPGELCVGGDGLARGYLNKPELTAEKFIKNPFVEGGRIYRTGDLARWLPDGNIEYLGRMDKQVKIRGFRIEIEEIEQQLLNSQLVGDVVVTVNLDNGGNKYLCAYFTAKEPLEVARLRKYLGQKLPSYMIPSYFLQLDHIPLTTNGKVDKRSLPAPEAALETSSDYLAPRNDVEDQLASIFSEVLEVTPIGIKDNFFEMGGHSLKAVKLMNMIHKAFSIKLALQDLFKLPTIELLAEKIQEEVVVSYDEIESLGKREYYELSNAQQRLWIVNQLEKESTSYNLPGVVTLYEKVDQEIVNQVFKDLIQRHEGFRTRFTTVDGKPVQIIEDTVDFALQVMDISTLAGEEVARRRGEIFQAEATKVFDLGVAPLLRVTLVKIEEEEYDLIFSMHHIISDGWSLEVLRREFYFLYKGYRAGRKEVLPPLRVQYKDFAVWQNKMIADEKVMEEAKKFWVEQLSGEIEPLNLPVNPTGRNTNERNSSAYQFFLSEDLKNQIKDLAKEHQTSIFVVMLTALSLYLAELTGQEDVLIGTAGSGREHESLQNVIGYFINTTILRNTIDEELRFNDLIDQVKENTLKALEYQNYPLESILDELKIQYPEISVFFNMLNMGQSDREELESFEAFHVEKVQDVKFDLVFYVMEYKNGIQVNCNYLSSLFKPTRIEYMMGEYVDLLEMLLEAPDVVPEECI